MSHQAWPDDNFRKTPSTPPSRRTARDIPMPSATGGTASQIAEAQRTSSSAGRYAKLLKSARRRRVLWAVFFFGSVILGFSLSYYFWICAGLFALGSEVDRGKLKYNLTPDAQAAFNAFVESFKVAASSQRVRMIDRQGRAANSYQRKVNSGMSTVIHTERASATTRPRDFLVNLPVPTLKTSRRSLYFLPDKIVLRDGGRYAELSYREVSVLSSTSPTAEIESVPKDARQVGTTWTYVNKDGGPDHRFKSNPTVPILLYDKIVLASMVGGFESEWQFSRTGSIGGWVSNLHARGAAHAL